MKGQVSNADCPIVNNDDGLSNSSVSLNVQAENAPQAGDLEKNIHALLQSAFTKLALVSREEFDVQAEVLRKTREKLDAIEKQLSELEQNQK